MSYTRKEIQWALKAYLRERERLISFTPGTLMHARLMDIYKAINIAAIGRDEYVALLICGIYGLTIREAAVALKISPGMVHKLYMQGLHKMLLFLNGGTNGVTDKVDTRQ